MKDYQSVIKTPVDDLVDLIFERKKIAVNEASKELKIPVSQIEEWAMALQEHNVISIQYRLDGMLLLPNSLTQEDYNKKLKKFVTRKKEIHRRIDKLERELYRPEVAEEDLSDDLKKLDKETDDTICDYLYLYNIMSRRRKPPEIIKQEKQTYENAIEVDQKVDKVLKKLKDAERQANKIEKIKSDLKSDIVLLNKQTENVEKIDLKDFIYSLTKLEKKLNEVETKRNEYLRSIEIIKTKLDGLRQKIIGDKK